jgi:hypothetical protein
MPHRPLTEADLSQATSKRYPNPFFDLANNYIPKNIKTLFKFCRTFFYTNGFLRNVVTKLTEYPITDILYDTSIDSTIRRKYDKILHRTLKIKSFLIEVGLDYYTYGNAFISSNLQFKRYLKCTSCGHTEPIDNIKFKLKKFEFHGNCKECKAKDILMGVEDDFINTIESFNLIKWAPENIDIEYNPLSGVSKYFYTIPPRMKTRIIQGDVSILKDVPYIFIEALKKRKKIEMDPTNFFHFKRPSLAEDDFGWGKPLILPALKDIYYLQTLRRGNEAIANEHIVPKKAVFPANTTTLDPFTQMNLGKWRTQIEAQIKKWKKDPNHIGVFPIPIGYQELGGNARTLLLTPEMKFLEESIINSLGVPLEFIKGGTTWTGSSISLRIVENHFITYRELLTDFLNHFLVDKLVNVLNYPEVTLKFKKFKMADDAESKQLAINLNASGKISDSRLLDEFGYSYNDESEAMKRIRSEMRDDQIEAQEATAEAQGRAQIILSKYNTRAQKAGEDELFKMRMELFQDELATEMGSVPDDPEKIVERYVMEFAALPQQDMQIQLSNLSRKMPYTYTIVAERLNYLFTSGGAGNIENTAQAPQEHAPNAKGIGNRKQDEIPITGEKHKGSTKGTPS